MWLESGGCLVNLELAEAFIKPEEFVQALSLIVGDAGVANINIIDVRFCLMLAVLLCFWWFVPL